MIKHIINFTAATMMTAATVNIDGNIGEVESSIENFFKNINSAQYNTTQFILNLIFLLICFAVKYCLYFKIVDIDTSNSEGKKLIHRYRNYALAHCLISYVFAFLVCYILVKLANSQGIVIIWNMIVAPLIGFIASIWFNNEFLTKYESQYKILRNPLNESDKKETKNDSNKLQDNNHNEINININNGENNSTDDKFVLNGDEKLSDSKKIEATINRIIDVQKEQSVILERHTQELKDQNHMLKNMQILMKNNIKFELEDMIYTALNRGYVTQAEDKKIRIKYRDYRNNDGNGDLKELYESRYLDLDVHEHQI